MNKKTILYEYCHALSNYLIVVSAGHLNKNNIGTLSHFECATIIGEHATLKTLLSQ